MPRMMMAGCLVAVLGLAGALSAQEPMAPVAKVESGKEGIRWSPRRGLSAVQVKVDGPGFEWTRSFQAGETPVFGVETQRARLVDGVYTWELRGAPKLSDEAREIRKKLRDAPDRGVGPTPKELILDSAGELVQSGSFTVVGGSIVSPEGEEPTRREPATGDLEIAGDLRVRGAKQFAVADPADQDAVIHFAALEGPEVGTYYRGTARTEGGEVVIALPAAFGKMTEAEGLTVQLTPLAGWSRLYVREKSPDRLVVASADGVDAEFDFLIQGVRKGYADFNAERPAGPRR